MSTAASFEESSQPRLVVIRPAQPDESGKEDTEHSGGAVVRLPSQGERTKRRAAEGSAAAVRSLNPEAADREVVAVMSSKIAQAVLEVLSGVRSVQQLSRWLDTMCLSALTTRARLHAEACRAQLRRQSHDPSYGNVATLHHQPIVHSVHCSPVAPGIFESSVVISDANRFRAVAMRFERSKGLWKVTALQIG